jgi:hypothetical protein
VRKVLRRATKNNSPEDLPVIQPHQTFFQPCSLLSQPHNLVVTPIFANAFMNRLSRPSAILLNSTSSSNRISNTLFRSPPRLRALAIKMSTSKEAEASASQPVANGVYKPRYIDVRLSPCDSTCTLPYRKYTPLPKLNQWTPMANPLPPSR